MNLPNRLTLLRVILVPFFVASYLMNMRLVALIIFVIASFTDMLDGKIARKRNLITNFGKIMDPLADKVLVYSALCLMVQDQTIPGWTLIVILAREFTVAGMRAVAASEGIVIAAGMSGKIKTVLQMIAVAVLIFYPVILIENISKLVFMIGIVVFYISLFMTVYSGTEYVIKNKEVFKG